MNEQLFTGILWIHIISGSLALIAGPIAMFNQDGGKLHRKSGIIYFYSMMVIFVSSIILSIVRENWFLFMVGIFSCYLVIMMETKQQVIAMVVVAFQWNLRICYSIDILFNRLGNPNHLFNKPHHGCQYQPI